MVELTDIFTDFNTLTVLFAVNILISLVVLGYSYYLYTIEKKYNAKLDNINDFANQILAEANAKALNILKNSEYLSKTLRKEIDENFDKLLESLVIESKDLYAQIETEYLNVTKKFTQDVEEKAEQEIESISQQLVSDTKVAEKAFEKKYADEYQKALDDIERFKIEQKEQFRVEMQDKLEKIIKELIPQNISIEDHHKIVADALEKAYSDKVFT